MNQKNVSAPPAVSVSEPAATPFPPPPPAPNRTGRNRLRFGNRLAVAILLGWLPASLDAQTANPETNSPARTGQAENLPASPKLPSLFLIGDSTVRNGQGTGTGGQWGWGDFLAPFFDTNRINVVNCAHGGTSSRTFYRDQWPRVAAMLKPGDCVIMQFGHNDGGPVNDASRARGTIKGVGAESQEITNLITKKSEVVHTFGWYLAKFVTDAKARGATAIICSPIPHKQHWEGGRDFASIADWDEQAAKNNGALFFDLTMVITGAYKKEGADKVATFFADKGTHTTGSGAQFNAACVIAGLKSLPNEPLEKFFSEKSRTVEPYKPDTQDISTNTSPLQP